MKFNFFKKNNESLAENKKKEIDQSLLKYKHGNNIHEQGKSKTSEPQKFVLNLSQVKINMSPFKMHLFITRGKL